MEYFYLGILLYILVNSTSSFFSCIKGSNIRLFESCPKPSTLLIANVAFLYGSFKIRAIARLQVLFYCIFCFDFCFKSSNIYFFS